MSTDRARQHTTAAVGGALFDARALTGSRRLTPLEHGWRVFHGSEQIASGYTSDNAPGHTVEFALNQYLLAERPVERVALMRWLEHQKQRFGGRDPRIHQRRIAVDWFWIGFDSAELRSCSSKRCLSSGIPAIVPPGGRRPMATRWARRSSLQA